MRVHSLASPEHTAVDADGAVRVITADPVATVVSWPQVLVVVGSVAARTLPVIHDEAERIGIPQRQRYGLAAKTTGFTGSDALRYPSALPISDRLTSERHWLHLSVEH
jgi:hypothetical protein